MSKIEDYEYSKQHTERLEDFIKNCKTLKGNFSIHDLDYPSKEKDGIGKKNIMYSSDLTIREMIAEEAGRQTLYIAKKALESSIKETESLRKKARLEAVAFLKDFNK